jgi:hypothetical protein
MALRVGRGLFRLWLVLSVLWIGGVGVVTWCAFLGVPFVRWDDPIVEDRKLFGAKTEKERLVRIGIVYALVPPVFVLGLGSGLVWAVRGFR